MFELRWAQCRRVKPALWDYASERLSEETMERVERHLHGCASCDRELASLKRAQNLLAACRAQEEPAPRADWSDLRQRIVADGLAHIATPSLSRRVSKIGVAGCERMALGNRAPWTMQLATSAAGGFAAVLVLALGYGTFHSRGTAPMQRAEQKETLAANNAAPMLPPSPMQKAQTSASDTHDMALVGNIIIQALNNAHIQDDTVAADNSTSSGVHSDTSTSEVSASAQNVSTPESSSTFKANGKRREHKTGSRSVYAEAAMPPKMTFVGLHTTSARNSVALKTPGFASHTPKFRAGNTKPGTQIASAPQAQAASRYALEHVQPVGSDGDEANGYVVGLVRPVSRDEDGVY